MPPNKYYDSILNRLQAKIYAFMDDIRRGTNIFEGRRSIEEQLSEEYHARFLIELIQNADDACGMDGQILAVIRQEPSPRVVVFNTGKGFTRKNFESLCKLYNERGIVLAGAYVTERIIPRVAYIDHGARIDPIKIGEIDRGGAVNTISPNRQTSKNCVGQATSGYLVEVEKLSNEELEQWKREYPEAFQREFHPDSGLCYNTWVEEGDVS